MRIDVSQSAAGGRHGDRERGPIRQSRSQPFDHLPDL